VNYDPATVEAARLTYDTHLDYFVADSAIDCHRDHLMIGDRLVKVLSMGGIPLDVHAIANGRVFTMGDRRDGQYVIALDADTGLPRDSARVLASTLAEAEFAGKRFLFVGHADRRGTAEGNMTLSMQRAVAIFNAVVALQPSLTGRIITEGRGSEEPLALGNTEEDYRVNRRLEVILK
jgi:hypothetical protein